MPSITPKMPSITPTIPAVTPSITTEFSLAILPTMPTITPEFPLANLTILPTMPKISTISIDDINEKFTTLINPTMVPRINLSGNINDDYYKQDIPRTEEFKFNATPENSNYIQSVIETARSIYPSFDQYIGLGAYINANNYNAFNIYKSIYPSYMKDASPFEIFKIYNGPAAESARNFLHNTFSHMRGGDIKDEMDRYMRNLGFRDTYLGYVRINNPVVNPVEDDRIPLTPENFSGTITPDYAILMEAWRLKALENRGPGMLSNLDLIGLREITRRGWDSANEIERREYFNIGNNMYRRPIYTNAPVLKRIGFDKRTLIDAINSVYFINSNPSSGLPELTKQFIQYQGENLINNSGKDLSTSHLTYNKSMPKTYYMMLYNELMIRGFLDNTQF